MNNSSETDIHRSFSAQELHDLLQPLGYINKPKHIAVEGNLLVMDFRYGKLTFSPNVDLTWTASFSSDEIVLDDVVLENPVIKAKEDAEQAMVFDKMFGDLPADTGAFINREDVLNAHINSILHVVYAVQTKQREKELSDRIPTLVVTRAGGACPFQAEGTLDGLPFYFRYRGGAARLRVANTDEEIFNAPLYESSLEYGDYLNGSLNNEEFVAIFTHLITDLKKAGIRWEFVSRKEESNTFDNCQAWGHTAKEAWDNLHHLDEGSKMSTQSWTEYLAEKQLDPHSPTVDNRVFPDKVNFTVLPSTDPEVRSIAELEKFVLKDAAEFQHSQEK